jgi:hypothetical protein
LELEIRSSHESLSIGGGSASDECEEVLGSVAIGILGFTAMCVFLNYIDRMRHTCITDQYELERFLTTHVAIVTLINLISAHCIASFGS